MQAEFVRVSGRDVELPFAGGEDGFRTVSDQVLTGVLDLPTLNADLVSNWVSGVGVMEAGDIVAIASMTDDSEPAQLVMTLRAQLEQWAHANSIGQAAEMAELVLLACRGATFHHDGIGFEKSVFCVVWLDDTPGLELVFPHIETRIPLNYGTLILFDSGQPHGVLPAGKVSWSEEDYDRRVGTTQVFVSLDLNVCHPAISQLLCIEIRTLEEDKQFWGYRPRLKKQYRGDVDPETGAWLF